MSLKLNERYPGRFDNPSAGYPQGSFKNRTSPTAKDGSYLEKDWANDKEGFFQSLLDGAAVEADGFVDSVGSSQYYDSMRKIIKDIALESSPVVGDVRNGRMSVAVASASGTYTADDLVVKTALGGSTWLLSSFNKTVNLATVGAGGMDTGTAPASGFVGIYAIYNPTTGVSALLAVNATAGVVPEVYGGVNMPAGYTASALISVWPTNASSQLVIGSLTDRTLALVSAVQLTVTTATSTPISATMGGIPYNAKRFGGILAVLGSNVGAALQFAISPLANVVGAKALYGIVQVASGQIVTPFDIAVITPRLAFYTATVTSGAFQYQIQMSEYTI